jgi:DNA-binding PadR family transcriptional regulator
VWLDLLDMGNAQTETAVLGALSVEPMTGYALRQTILDVLGHFWSESFGQIYPTLNRLSDDGMLVKSAGGRSDSSTHTITQAGLKRLKTLLAENTAERPPRSTVLLRLFFGRHLGPQHCLQLVDEAEKNAQAQLAHCAALREAIKGRERSADDAYWLITVDHGERTARAVLDWAAVSRGTLLGIVP